MLRSISFENYKAFQEKQTLELRPVTILIGKNSSGKSSVAKLFTLLENSLSQKISEPLLVKNEGVELGAEFIDLVFGKIPSPINFELNFKDGRSIYASIIQEKLKYELTILEWKYTDSQKSLLLKYSPEHGYQDAHGSAYKCEFKGIIPTKLLGPDGKDIAVDFNLKANIEVDYIGPFRVLPERQFYLSGQINFSKTGIKGENAYSILGVSKLVKDNLCQSVGKWFRDRFEGWELLVEDSNKPFVSIALKKEETIVNLVDVGQGMNQVLPLVVRANLERQNSIVVIEQPELHLHPAAHGDLIELFSRSAKRYNQCFLIETHSETILLRLRKLIVENDFNLTSQDVAIYWVGDDERKGQKLMEITINNEGTLSDWPEGVFNENVSEIIEIKKAIAKKPAAR